MVIGKPPHHNPKNGLFNVPMSEIRQIKQSPLREKPSTKQIVLGLEASCDETAASVVARDLTGKPEILSNVVFSQVQEHEVFGGVVPEIAARAHVEAMDGIVRAALHEADVSLKDIDAIAATAGPGLNGGLLVATMTGKAMAAAMGKPFYPVNHLEGHALTPRLVADVPFPYLLLLVSGGHTQILKVNGLGDYTRLATTIDDALGEAFDKTAKLLGLGFPGGPAVERMALDGDPTRFNLPRPMLNHDTLNLSLSGLKTAVRQTAQKLEPVTVQDISDICASFQQAVSDLLEDRVKRAMTIFIEETHLDDPTLVVAGGVAANSKLRAMLEELCASSSWRLVAPPLKLCTDNAAMIAWVALENIATGAKGDMSFVPRPRWPLDETQSLVGSGKKGAKV